MVASVVLVASVVVVVALEGFFVGLLVGLSVNGLPVGCLEGLAVGLFEGPLVIGR